MRWGLSGSLRGGLGVESGGLEGDDGDFGGAVETEGNAYGAYAAVDVELHLVETEDSVGVLLAHGRQDEGAEEGQVNLAAVGVAGEHEIDDGAAGVLGDNVREVGFVGHEDDRAIGAGGNGEVEIGMAGAGVLYTAEPEAGAVALDGSMLIDQDGSAVVGEGASDHGGADGDVVVAEDGVAEGTGEGGEDFGAAVGGVSGGDEGEGSHGDEVAGDEDEVGGEIVDLVDDALEEEGFGELVEMNIADLDDAEVVEGVGQV